MIPVIDLAECTDCESCLAVCPEVFKINSENAHIEVISLPEYPHNCIQEAISVCPADCITWERSKNPSAIKFEMPGSAM